MQVRRRLLPGDPGDSRKRATPGREPAAEHQPGEHALRGLGGWADFDTLGWLMFGEPSAHAHDRHHYIDCGDSGGAQAGGDDTVARTDTPSAGNRNGSRASRPSGASSGSPTSAGAAPPRNAAHGGTPPVELPLGAVSPLCPQQYSCPLCTPPQAAASAAPAPARPFSDSSSSSCDSSSATSPQTPRQGRFSCCPFPRRRRRTSSASRGCCFPLPRFGRSRVSHDRRGGAAGAAVSARGSAPGLSPASAADGDAPEAAGPAADYGLSFLPHYAAGSGDSSPLARSSTSRGSPSSTASSASPARAQPPPPPPQGGVMHNEHGLVRHVLRAHGSARHGSAVCPLCGATTQQLAEHLLLCRTPVIDPLSRPRRASSLSRPREDQVHHLFLPIIPDYFADSAGPSGLSALLAEHLRCADALWRKHRGVSAAPRLVIPFCSLCGTVVRPSDGVAIMPCCDHVWHIRCVDRLLEPPSSPDAERSGGRRAVPCRFCALAIFPNG
eukprot:TRINITY_DN12971_c0_g1_i1.p1 TRINITY_DN12971_c0_g1~~TRINITY_DN12971_c0_g1_i1.p1  ORF type:complete len:531 (+),score=85.90 TRINITY_DN12971_c0_g1_i1:103-1593(+)